MNHVSIIQYTFAVIVFPIMPDHNLICIHAYITFVLSYAHHCTLVQDEIMLAIFSSSWHWFLVVWIGVIKRVTQQREYFIGSHTHCLTFGNRLIEKITVKYGISCSPLPLVPPTYAATISSSNKTKHVGHTYGSVLFKTLLLNAMIGECLL